MKKDYGNTFILNTLDLPVMNDLYTVSSQMRVSETIIYLLTNKAKNYYRQFKINKRNGETRLISHPSYALKTIQRWILEEILYKLKVSNNAFAFKRKIYGIKENAQYHRQNAYYLQLDLKDFFDSISRERVFYLFKNIGYNITVSNILSNFCTLDNKLPQGGVCSPTISNLLCYKLDRRLDGLCSKRDILYTRYADDMTFSCNNKSDLKQAEKVIYSIIKDEGFLINKSKTRYLSPISCKRINGIIINEKEELIIDRKLKRKVRAMIHRAITTGNYSEREKIIGYVSYINSIESDYLDKKIIPYINKLIEKDYSFYESIVDKYNKNKFFAKAEEMKLNKSITNIKRRLDDSNSKVVWESIHAREKYLRKNNEKDLDKLNTDEIYEYLREENDPTIIF